MNTDKLVGTVLISEKVVMYTKQTFIKINIKYEKNSNQAIVSNSNVDLLHTNIPHLT